ncbi:CAP domain-containing protein [Limimaricola cinnabarinus]|uniref:CAP domain-containing protein n=1 Tax=Limimaricola cinnabarinus TaxID=1125964 RepID=UPI0039E4D325
MSIANDLERQMLSLINEDRTAAGLNPVKLETNLNASSEDHSSWMLRTDSFSHTGQGGSSATERMRDASFEFSGSWASGENIAWQSERGAAGLEDDVVDLHDSLMNSPGHRANILNPNFEYVGIGIERGDFKGWDGVMVTQNFARTGGSVDLDGGDPVTGPDTSPGDSLVARNTAPVVTMDDVTVARVRGGYRTSLEDHLKVKDADGDTIAWYELRDTEGRDNFIFKGKGRLDAENGIRIDADDLGAIRIRADGRPGDTELEVRAFDGREVSDWESFTLTTLSAEDWTTA